MLEKLSKNVVNRAIQLYQIILSPLTGGHCRFYPTCSEYAKEAVAKFGVVNGGFKSITRISKCHPFHAGGYDPVK